MEIRFYDASDLRNIVHRVSVGNEAAKSLFAISPTVLMFTDMSEQSREVYRIDCRSSAPKPVATGLRLQRKFTSDMT